MSEKTILIIEDDPVIRLGLHVSLRANHYKTFMADDAIVSIAEARKNRPDLIILDLGLPAGDGFVVMERLKQFPALSVIPIVVVSGRDPRVAERRAIEPREVLLEQAAVNDALRHGVRVSSQMAALTPDRSKSAGLSCSRHARAAPRPGWLRRGSETEAELLGVGHSARVGDLELARLAVMERLDRQAAQSTADRRERALGGVVRPRQVGEHQPRDARVLERGRELGGLFVGEVPQRARHAALEPGRIRPRFEHRRAVVRLEHHEVAPLEQNAQLARRVPEIGRDPEAPAARRDAQRHVRRVVGDRERLDLERAEVHGAAGGVRLDLDALARDEGHAGVHEDRRAQGATERERVRGVVAVVVAAGRPKNLIIAAPLLR